jgi:uncharacterized membrane protein
MTATHSHLDEKETGRVEAFSDGVFAIAITLLVLDLKVPHATELGGRTLASALLRQWPIFLAYLTSFATILVMWVNHHVMFGRIRRVDSKFLFLNGLLLLFVTFVPFPTSLVAEYFREGGEPARTAGLVYSGTYVLIAVAYNLLWRYAAAGRHLLDPHIPQERIVDITRKYAPGIPLYLVAVALSLVSVPASIALCLAMAVFFASTGSLDKRGSIEAP